MNKHLLLFTLAISLLGRVAYSQILTGANVIQPSPNVATLQRFADYPVSYSTGVAQVGIPLYTIKSKNYSFPISMDNHSSGTKAGYNFSPLGVGWALNTTGFISREIRGRPDEEYSTLETSAADLSTNYPVGSTYPHGTYDYLLLADLEVPNGYDTYSPSSTRLDPAHDIFTFNVNGLSGKFIISSGGIVQSTFSNLQISGSLGTGGDAGWFTITDEKGITYKFGQSGSYGAIENVKITELLDDEGGSTTTKYVSSSWFLYEIDAPGETINFTYHQRYTDDTGTYASDYIYGSRYNLTTATYGYGASPDVGSELDTYYAEGGLGTKDVHSSTGTVTNDYKISVVTGITFNEGSITFDYESVGLRLNSCTVNNTAGLQIKKINFTYGLPSGAGRQDNNANTELTTLYMYGAAGSTPETYTFTYWGSAYGFGGSDVGKDWWGYVNGSSTTPPGDGYNYTGSSRAGSASANGMLETITYPTGGTATFTYENNQYKVSGTTYYGPGMRIQSITTDDGAGTTPVTKSYVYGNSTDGAESGFGQLVRIPDPTDFYSEQTYYCIDDTPDYFGTYILRTYTPDPVDGMVEAYQQPMYYRTVTEYTKSYDSSDNGKVVYTFNPPDFNLDASGSPRTFKLKDWKGPKQQTRTVYKYQGGSYIKVESDATSYTEFHYSKVPQIKLFRTEVVTFENRTAEVGRPLESALIDQTFAGVTTYTNPYSVIDNPFESGVELPTLETHTTYNGTGTVALSTSTIYAYEGNEHTLPTRIITQTSRGDTLLTEKSYYKDLFTSSNVLDPVESRTYRIRGGNKRLISATYTIWAATDFPSAIYSVETAVPLTSFDTAHVVSGAVVTDSHYVLKQTFNYDGKNTKEVYAPNGSHTSYVWSYNSEYPVAKIENADYSTVQTALGGSTTVATNRDAVLTDAALKTYLDNLRTASSLSAAQITTYSYTPLIGLTSMTDPKGLTTYYTYDGSNRLQGVWDHSKNLVKSYCYNYKNQLTACPVLYPPGQVFVRFESSTPTTASPVSDGEGGTNTTTTVDMVVHIYADAACTIPLVLTSDITVELDDTYYFPNTLDDDYLTGGDTNFYPITAGNSTYDIGNITTVVVHDYLDEEGDPIEDVGGYSYIPQSGANYIVED